MSAKKRTAEAPAVKPPPAEPSLPSSQRTNQMVWDAMGSDHGFCNPIKCRIADEDDED